MADETTPVTETTAAKHSAPDAPAPAPAPVTDTPSTDAQPGQVGTPGNPPADAVSPTGTPVADASKVEPAAEPVENAGTLDNPAAGTTQQAAPGSSDEVLAYEPKVDGTGNAEAEHVAELYQSVTHEPTGAMIGAQRASNEELRSNVVRSAPANTAVPTSHVDNLETTSGQADTTTNQPTADEPAQIVPPTSNPAGTVQTSDGSKGDSVPTS
jgi:hypothetical protein